MKKTLSSYGVTGKHGPSYGARASLTARRATKRYFHPVTDSKARIKARRKQGRR